MVRVYDPVDGRLIADFVRLDEAREYVVLKNDHEMLKAAKDVA